MTGRCAGSAACAAVLLLACGRSEDRARLPAFPVAVSVPLPRVDAEVAFRFRYQAPDGSAPWAAFAGTDDWLWLGRLEAGTPRTVWATPEAPEPEATGAPGAALLPAGQAQFAGFMAALLDARLAGGSGLVAALGPQLALLESGLPEPANEARAMELALGLALLESGAAFLPRLLGEFEGAVVGLDSKPVADLRFPLAAKQAALVDWQETWFPYGMPQSAAFARIEVQRDAILPLVERRLVGWGFPAPLPPRTDLVLELHLVELGERVGAVLALPVDWLGEDWTQADSHLMELAALLDAGPGGVPIGAPELQSFVDHGSRFLVVGEAGFAEDLRGRLERDRPRPFAEDRHGWPRGAAGGIVDLNAARKALQSAAPFSIPGLQGDGVRRPQVEIVMVMDHGAFRVRASAPAGHAASTSGPAAALQALQEHGRNAVVGQVLEFLLGSEGARQVEAELRAAR